MYLKSIITSDDWLMLILLIIFVLVAWSPFLIIVMAVTDPVDWQAIGALIICAIATCIYGFFVWLTGVKKDNLKPYDSES